MRARSAISRLGSRVLDGARKESLRRVGWICMVAALCVAAGGVRGMREARAAEAPSTEGGTGLQGASPAAQGSSGSSSGKVLYERYCSSCHGVAGKGDGPVASSLVKHPTDLTALARQSGGRLDEARLMAVIDGRRLVEAHGPREMPVWGAVFDQELEGKPFAGYTGLLRAQVLADYLATLQAR